MTARIIPGLGAAILILAVSGCAVFETPEWARRDVRPVPAVEHEPLDTRRFVLEDGTTIIGELQVIRSRDEDTFVDIARAYNLGFDELVQANPGVDPWLPGEGTRVVLPTQFILPDAPHEGIVLNIGQKRIFYFSKATPGQAPTVVTHPVGIGREGWQTPLGATKVVAKVKDPVWTVPASIRKEHAEAGDPLPARVPPGPDNPLGAHALRLGFPSYLIHGTNKPSGIGMRVSHGCVQMFPEDIAELFGEIAVGTPVRIVNQPQLIGRRGSELYLEVHPALEDDDRNHAATLDRWIRKEFDRRMKEEKYPAQAAAGAATAIDEGLVASTVSEGRGFPVRLTGPAADAASLAARARPTRNVVSYAAELPAPGLPTAAPDPARSN